LEWVVNERDRTCLWGMFCTDPNDGCQFGLDPHHVVKRSQGGDDVAENVITLCRKHHDLAEQNRIAPVALAQILNFLYGYEMPQLSGNEDSNPHIQLHSLR